MKYFIEKGTITLLNHIMTCDTQSETYWVNVDPLFFPQCQALLPSVYSKFPSVPELVPYGCNPWELLSAIQYQCGLKLKCAGNELLFTETHPFTDQHIDSIPFKVKLLLPPNSFTDPSLVLNEWYAPFFLSLPSSALKLSSRQASLQQQIEESLQYATVLLESSNSPLLASAYYQQAVLAQRRREFQASVAFANSLVAITHPYDPLYLRALGVQFYAGQDPLGVISDINDILSFYCASTSFYLPWIIFSVGMLALPQDAELGMEYVNRALSLCKEVLGSSHPTLARMDLEVADVGALKAS